RPLSIRQKSIFKTATGERTALGGPSQRRRVMGAIDERSARGQRRRLETAGCSVPCISLLARGPVGQTVSAHHRIDVEWAGQRAENILVRSTVGCAGGLSETRFQKGSFATGAPP